MWFLLAAWGHQLIFYCLVQSFQDDDKLVRLNEHVPKIKAMCVLAICILFGAIHCKIWVLYRFVDPLLLFSSQLNLGTNVHLSNPWSWAPLKEEGGFIFYK